MPEPMSDRRLKELKRRYKDARLNDATECLNEIDRLRVENKRLAVTLLMHCKECADAAIGTETGTSGHH